MTDIMQGAADLHIHSSPDLLPRLLSDAEVVDDARTNGLKAIVLKNHFEQTASRAQLVRHRAGDDLQVFGGIVLNPQASGGLNPYAAETALRLGARIVWFPTFGARFFQDHAPAGLALPVPVRPEHAISLEGDDADWDAVRSVLELIREHDATLATGHLGPAEILALIPVAKEMGVARIIVTHPEMPFVGLSDSQQRELAGVEGVWFERVAVSTLGRFGVSVPDIAASIRAVGVDTTVLSSDLGQPANPPPAAGLRDFAEALMDAGLPEADVRRMVSANPLTALGLR